MCMGMHPSWSNCRLHERRCKRRSSVNRRLHVERMRSSSDTRSPSAHDGADVLGTRFRVQAARRRCYTPVQTRLCSETRCVRCWRLAACPCSSRFMVVALCCRAANAESAFVARRLQARMLCKHDSKSSCSRAATDAMIWSRRACLSSFLCACTLVKVGKVRSINFSSQSQTQPCTAAAKQ